MNFGQLSGVIRSNIKGHSSLILSVGAGIGTIATSYLVARASFKASDVIREHELDNGTLINAKDRYLNRTKLVWKQYIPAGVSTAFTIGSIVGVNRIGTRKVLAAQFVAHAAERALAEYSGKVIEEFGARKDQSIRDKVAEDRVRKNPPPSQDILVTSPGHVLCCELFTGRYFISDMESLRRAENDLNEKLLRHDFATFDDFYYMIDLKQTSFSGDMGWKSDKLMKLIFTAVLTDDGRPCIAFEYNYTKTL